MAKRPEMPKGANNEIFDAVRKGVVFEEILSLTSDAATSLQEAIPTNARLFTLTVLTSASVGVRLETATGKAIVEVIPGKTEPVSFLGAALASLKFKRMSASNTAIHVVGFE